MDPDPGSGDPGTTANAHADDTSNYDDHDSTESAAQCFTARPHQYRGGPSGALHPMIRDANFADIPAMGRLLRAGHERSKYAGRVKIVEKSLEQMLVGLVAAQKQNGPQASFIQVVEHDGEVIGFMAGSLNRVYNIGDKLCAADLYLVNDGKRLKDTLALIDNYIEWARSNPKVIEIGLSWSDALPNAADIASIYQRKGAHKVGEQFAVPLDLKIEIAA